MLYILQREQISEYIAKAASQYRRVVLLVDAPDQVCYLTLIATSHSLMSQTVGLVSKKLCDSWDVNGLLPNVRVGQMDNVSIYH